MWFLMPHSSNYEELILLNFGINDTVLHNVMNHPFDINAEAAYSVMSILTKEWEIGWHVYTNSMCPNVMHLQNGLSLV